MRKAFTLLEVVIAIGVFAISVIAVIGLLAPLAKSASESADAEAATRVAGALTLTLQLKPLTAVAALLKSSTAGGHQLLAEDTAPNLHRGRDDPQILFASRDGLKIGAYSDPVWIEATAATDPNREKFFEIALIRNEALSPIGSESELASPYLAFTARLRWPAFVADRGSGAIEMGSNPEREVRYDHSQRRVMFFAGAVAR